MYAFGVAAYTSTVIHRLLAYTEPSMAARLMALVLAFVMTGAPVVTTACQAVCAALETGADGSGTGEHHSCHAAEPSNEVAITGAAHACGHSDSGDQVGSDQAVKICPAPALLAGYISFTPPDPESRRFASARIQHSPPDPLALTTQLRV
jgi:hypothetical protein